MVWTQFATFVDAIPGDAYVAEDGWGMHKSWDDVIFDTGSAAGPQEAEVRAMMAGLRWQAAIRHTSMPPMQKGSVLSDRNWSALLNDALILGCTRAVNSTSWPRRPCAIPPSSRPACPASGLRWTCGRVHCNAMLQT